MTNFWEAKLYVGLIEMCNDEENGFPWNRIATIFSSGGLRHKLGPRDKLHGFTFTYDRKQIIYCALQPFRANQNIKNIIILENN